MANNSIKKIQKESTLLIQKMLEVTSMLRGTYGIAYRRCGKPNCRCADREQKPHSFYRLSWVGDGKGHTRNIPESDRQWVAIEVQKYKQFKKNRRRYFKLQKKLSNQLDKLEKKLIDKTRMKKYYLL